MVNSSDPIADFLTRVRNAIMVKHKSCQVPYSKLIGKILSLLKKDGWIGDFELVKNSARSYFVVQLLYQKGESVIKSLQRISRPGRQVYVTVKNLPVVRNGIGVALVSTSAGLMFASAAKKMNMGGEVLAYIW